MDSVIDVDRQRLEALCKRWGIVQLALFGSRARGDARPDSDVDLLVTFADDSAVSLWTFEDLRGELSSLFGHRVDLVEERAIRNPHRRKAILADKRVI